jgi:hypothetical protein
MAISTYAELKTAVAAWLDRTDLTSVLADLVALAESDIRTDLRCRAMEQYTTGTLTGATLAHPTRYLEARSLTVDGKPFGYVTPEIYQAASDANSQRRIFTSIGETLYVLNGTSGDAYSLIYFQAFEAFDADADTNWLLTNHPNVYLFAACKQGGLYEGDDGKVAKFSELYQDALGRLASRERQSASSGGRMAIQSGVTE